MNKTLFKKSKAVPKAQAKKADATNRAGGKAYSYDARTAAAVFAMTSTFPDAGGTHQLSGADQLSKFIELLNECSHDFVAKLAVYARHNGKMKDAPLVAVSRLLRHKDGDARDLAERVFPFVVDNPVQYRNAIAVSTSGVLGPKNLSHRQMKVLNDRLFSFGLNYLAARGLTGQKPSLDLCIRLTHPNPKTQGDKQAVWDNFFKYVLGRDGVNAELLPKSLREYLAFKKDPENAPIPKGIEILQLMGMLPKHSLAAWGRLARVMSWTQIFKNLATLARHGAFEDDDTVQFVAEKLKDEDSVVKSRQFAYAIFNAYLYLTGENVGNSYWSRGLAKSDVELPFAIREALADALEVSVGQTPELTGQLVIGVDTSGSMHAPVTGHRQGATSSARLVDVAALFGAAALKFNPQSIILPFDNQVNDVSITHRDSVATIAKTLSQSGGGGTNISDVFRVTLEKIRRDKKFRPDTIMILSDMQTWVEGSGIQCYGGVYGRRGTAANELFKVIKAESGKDVKLVCWNLAAGETTQAVGGDVLNIGGFSESLWQVVSDFLAGKQAQKAKTQDARGPDVTVWLDEIDAIDLDADALKQRFGKK